MQAVLTADIVNSTRLNPQRFDELIGEIKTLAENNKIEFYRGDSFQVFFQNGADSFKTALKLRTATRKITPLKNLEPFDIRMSISLGKLPGPVGELAEAKDEIFVLSGRAFDEMGKGPKKMTIVSASPLASLGLDCLADYSDSLLENITAKQSAVIFELLNDLTQVETGKKLKKSLPTINKQAKAANWSRFQTLDKKFQDFVKYLDNE